MRDRLVHVQCENGKGLCAVAQKECTVMLGINGHAVVVAASFHGVGCRDGVAFLIDLGKFVRVSQVYIDLLGNRVVLRHASLAFERERLYDFVFLNIHNCLFFADTASTEIYTLSYTTRSR